MEVLAPGRVEWKRIVGLILELEGALRKFVYRRAGIKCIDMVQKWRQYRVVAIAILGIVWGGCWKNPYPSANKSGSMSRCFPYPPPGYEKKAHVELGLSPKKEKQKHKNKKKKRKRESNKTTNDVLDKDKRSNKIYQTGLDNDGFRSKNVRLLEMNDAPSAVAFEKSLVTIDRVQANSSRSEQPLDSLSHEPALYSKESNGTVDSELPLILARPAGASNGVVASAVAPSSRCLLGDDDSLNWQRHTQFMPEVERVWSAVDDQEWLFLHNNELHLKPKAKVEVDGSSQVWTEALFLPSVGMYALPYVVPY